jgi:predicted naringenin-chalcone synthase
MKTTSRSPEIRPSFLVGLGTADAPYRAKQMELARLYEAFLAAATGDARLGRKARLIFSQARLDTRQFALPDVVDPEAARLYRGSTLPTTGARMEAFAELAPDLAEQACRKALNCARARPEDVSALVVATCTSTGAPDLDVELATRLGLSPAAERSQLVWMSCTAAFPALRTAQRAASATGGLALVVCVELCSLHVRADAELGSLLAHSLFSDGAAAALVAPDGSASDTLAVFGEGTTRLVAEARDALRWEFTDHGFRAHLSTELPRLIEGECGDFVDRLLGADRGDVRSWCVHPGGPAILDAVERTLGLAPTALEASREVLRTRGNMSSATILYVLEQELARMAPGDQGLMLGFGTGLTLEGLRFERGGRPSLPRDNEHAACTG